LNPHLRLARSHDNQNKEYDQMKFSINLNDLSKEQLDKISSIVNEMLGIHSNVVADDEEENQFYEGCIDNIYNIIFKESQE
jgi:hypothetical protein